MKEWIICWVSKVGNKTIDHNGIDNNALIVKAGDLLEAYNVAIDKVIHEVWKEGASEYKVYEVAIMDDEVF